MGVQLAKRSRQLALANALGARLDAMTELVEIAILANQVAAAIRSAQLVQPVGAT